MCIMSHVGITAITVDHKEIPQMTSSMNDWHNRTNRLVKVIKVCFCLKENKKREEKPQHLRYRFISVKRESFKKNSDKYKVKNYIFVIMAPT